MPFKHPFLFTDSHKRVWRYSPLSAMLWCQLCPQPQGFPLLALSCESKGVCLWLAGQSELVAVQFKLMSDAMEKMAGAFALGVGELTFADALERKWYYDRSPNMVEVSCLVNTSKVEVLSKTLTKTGVIVDLSCDNDIAEIYIGRVEEFLKELLVFENYGEVDEI